MWVRDLPGHVILHVPPPLWNSPLLTAQWRNLRSRSVSAICLILNFLSFLSWLSAVAGINLTVLKETLLLWSQTSSACLCAWYMNIVHEQSGEHLSFYTLYWNINQSRVFLQPFPGIVLWISVRGCIKSDGFCSIQHQHLHQVCRWRMPSYLNREYKIYSKKKKKLLYPSQWNGVEWKCYSALFE